VEIAACTAPRPLLLVCCTGDWTKNVPTFEGPAIQRAYKALGVEDRFRAVQFNYGHNYNQDSREAVYAWLARWLQGKPDVPKIPEPAFTVEKKEDLEVFGAGHPVPEGAVDAEGLKKVLREKVKAQLESLRPKDAASLARFREVMAPALTTILSVRPPKPVELSVERPPKTVLFVTLPRGTPVEPEPPSGGNKEQLKAYPTTFFRTELARHVQDILDMLAEIDGRPGTTEIHLVGKGEAAIPTLLASSIATSPKLKQVIVDLQGIEDAEALWTGPRPHPAMLRVGGLRTAAILCAPRRLVLHNTRGNLDAGQIRDAYRAAGAENALTVSEAAWDDGKIEEALK
jgi:hypothetical protein